MIDICVVAYEDRRLVGELITQIAETVPFSYELHVTDCTLRNRGWAQASNDLARAGDQPFICFLNPDLTLLDGWLSPVMDAFERRPYLACAGPLCLDGIPWPRTPLPGGLTAWVCGAAMVVRRQVFEEIGGFDAVAFPHEWSETDAERRMQEQGYTVETIEEAQVVHHFNPAKSDQVKAWERLGRASYETRWGR